MGKRRLAAWRIPALWLAAWLVTGTPAAAGADAGISAPIPERKAIRLPHGLTLGYLEFGDAAKPPLVYLHGITNSSLGYVPLGQRLARDFHVYLVDMRGHGISDKPECCYTRLDFAYDIKLLLDALGIPRAHVAGHSLGSMVAQTFAAYWPERVDRLVLIASTLGPPSPLKPDEPRPPPLLGAAWDAEIRKLEDPIDPDSPFMRSWWDVNGLDPAIQSMMRRESARIPARIWRAMLDQGASSRDLRITADWIRAPTLLVFGGKDVLFGQAEREDLIAWMPKAQVALFPELGHSLPEEDPVAVGTRLRDFLLQ